MPLAGGAEFRHFRARPIACCKDFQQVSSGGRAPYGSLNSLSSCRRLAGGASALHRLSWGWGCPRQRDELPILVPVAVRARQSNPAWRCFLILTLVMGTPGRTSRGDFGATCRPRVEPSRSEPNPGRSGIGATLPLTVARTKVGFPPQTDVQPIRRQETAFQQPLPHRWVGTIRGAISGQRA